MNWYPQTLKFCQSTLDVQIRSLFIKSYHKAEKVFTREKFWALHFLKRQSLPPSQCLCKKIYQFSRVMFNLKHKYLTLHLYKYRKKKKGRLTIYVQWIQICNSSPANLWGLCLHSYIPQLVYTTQLKGTSIFIQKMRNTSVIFTFDIFRNKNRKLLECTRTYVTMLLYNTDQKYFDSPLKLDSRKLWGSRLDASRFVRRMTRRNKK